MTQLGNVSDLLRGVCYVGSTSNGYVVDLITCMYVILVECACMCTHAFFLCEKDTSKKHLFLCLFPQQTEEMRCRLLLRHEASTDQHPNTDLLTRHNGSAPLLVREHIYPPFTCTYDDWHSKVPCSAPKRNDTPDPQKAVNHTPAHLQLHSAGTSVSASKDRIKINSTVYEKVAAISLTPQTTHVNSDNTQSQTGCTDRLTQTDLENTRNNAAGKRNQKHVSFSRGHTENCSTSSSCLLSQGQPSTPLFFHNLQHMQWKILTGQVDRRIYMNRCKHGLASTRSVVSAGALFSRGHHIS